MSEPESAPSQGLHRTEIVLFVGGVFAFALLMLVFASPLDPSVYLPLVGGWIIAGITFVWWFDRYLARASRKPPDQRKVVRLEARKKKR